MKETTLDQQSPRPVAKGNKKSAGFTAKEQAAMRARSKELKAAAGRAEGESAALAAIAEMPEPGRKMAERLHAIITSNAPGLAPKTWYGMPAYADKDGKVVCFFRGAEKFIERYMTFGFNPEANLDEGGMWPVGFALIELNAEVEERIAALVKKAVS